MNYLESKGAQFIEFIDAPFMDLMNFLNQNGAEIIVIIFIIGAIPAIFRGVYLIPWAVKRYIQEVKEMNKIFKQGFQDIKKWAKK